MAKYLLNVTEVYRVDREEEAIQMIQDAKDSSEYTLIKQSYTYKERKQKGEVVDSWYQVSLKKVFTDEKEPEFSTHITYSDGVGGEF